MAMFAAIARHQGAPSRAAVLQAIAKDANGIGYGGAAYGAAQLDMMQAEQDNWIERAAISHRYNVDIIGLQTPYNIMAHGDATTQKLATWLKTNYIDKGKLGLASGEGFYSYK